MKAVPYYRLRADGNRALILVNIDNAEYIIGKENIWTIQNNAMVPPVVWASREEIKKALRRSWIETQTYDGGLIVFISLAKIVQCGYLKNLVDSAKDNAEIKIDFFAYIFTSGQMILTADDYFKVHSQLQELERGYR